jgi:3-oxoacyl-[acyl-carrier protein] reductase
MNDDATNLKGQVAVVTGAGRGIGKAVAIGFAKAGARISVNELIPGPVATAMTTPGDAQQLSGAGGSE